MRGGCDIGRVVIEIRIEYGRYLREDRTCPRVLLLGELLPDRYGRG